MMGPGARVWICAVLAAGAVAAPAPSRAQAAALRDLPLVEVPVRGRPAGGLIAVLLTADGGWAGLDRDVAAGLAADGVPVVGWSSLDYYRRPRTPELASADLARVLRHYLDSWGGRRVLLVGYSFGADVLPLLVNRLPGDLRARVAGVALIGFSPSAVFEFHASEWVGIVRGRRYPTLAEVHRLADVPLLCVYGRGDSDEACAGLGMANARVVAIASGHRMGSVAAAVGQEVRREARELAHPPGGGPR
ncbi:MAG TPA: AcvB/VirJ family lysyl-phosphatidylglycerol hydrolase [Longimicrobium sp.]|jgi:type IV secretory pathway VirJ component|nr:AcvB/VirJ family lysyl-phosphatidylglycerol hydrolase [Longimicrobium sp.]